MSRRSPSYAPMCNQHLRFYLSNPKRTVFRDSLAEKQFKATQVVFESLSPYWQAQLQQVLPNRDTYDLLDSYIYKRLRDSGASSCEIDSFYNTLRFVHREIAIALGYITRLKSKTDRRTDNVFP